MACLPFEMRMEARLSPSLCGVWSILTKAACCIRRCLAGLFIQLKRPSNDYLHRAVQLHRLLVHLVNMPLIIILVVLVLLFGGGGYYMGPGVGYYGGGAISIVLVIVILYLLFGRGRGRV